ncbi:hypothetical protein AMS68_002438 [Peltaster fructicola]|uniref:Checkpoint protein RAD24-like helical bundle domain-containing protein n=1 Tax=Peltaster fructicola TaxID=286661 RepID=A0A6H0XQJ4_9PEZI|nr:hypothetical protein AMS68_002438 [Peltaster fructicola]
MATQRLSRKQAASAAGRHEPPDSSPKQQTLLSSPSAQNTATGKLKSLKTRASSKTAKSSTNTTRAPSTKSATAQTTSQDISKANGSIQSFFSAATQRLQTSQSSPRRASRASTPHEPTETIESDDDAASVLSLSKGSSTALALKKRKSYHGNGTFGRVAEDTSLPTAQKFRRTGEATRTPSMALNNDDKRPWTVQFEPMSVSELAVHKRKVDDVRGWLQSAFTARRNRALVIKGPAGAGKTTTLKLLASELKVDVLEWSNPAGKDYVDSTQASYAQFEDFMARSGRSSGLALVQDNDIIQPFYEDSQMEPIGNQLLLVEEFPNTFSKSSPALQSFRSAIAQHLVARGGTHKPVPLIMIISETLLSTNTAAADSFTTHRLLGPELSIHPAIDTIEFNTVAPTIIHKALDAVIVKEARKSGRRTSPGPAVLKRLADFGDIRSAISTLEFLCLRGDDDGNWSAKVAFSKPKKKPAEAPLTKIEKEALSWISSRESTLGIWHGVGKIIYNKRVDAPQSDTVVPPPPWLSQHRRARVPENDVNVLVNDIGTDTATFIAALHENYLLSCSGLASEPALDSVLGCIEGLSDSDLLSLDRFSSTGRAYSGSTTDTLRQDEMSFQVAVRDLLFSLPGNAKRTAPSSGPKIDAHRMYYPASLKLWRRREEVETVIDSAKLRLRSVLRSSARQHVDTAYSLANTNATPWITAKLQREDSSDGPIEDSSSYWLALASKELLVECLPYFARSLRYLTDDKLLFDLLKTITRITGLGSDDTNADDLDNAAGDEPGEHVEQWTTDVADEAIKPTRRARFSKKEDELAFGSSGLKLPAEHRTANLVLDDDDIVDD